MQSGTHVSTLFIGLPSFSIHYLHLKALFAQWLPRPWQQCWFFQLDREGPAEPINPVPGERECSPDTSWLSLDCQAAFFSGRVCTPQDTGIPFQQMSGCCQLSLGNGPSQAE